MSSSMENMESTMSNLRSFGSFACACAPVGGARAGRRRAVAASILATVAAVGFAAAPAAAAPPNDDCSTPTIIAGDGTFNFDLTGATTDPTQGGQACGAAGILNDVWFCWTAPSTGLVTISTCGLTNVDTLIAFYPMGTAGCGCPVAGQDPLCCNDNACGKQSQLSCETVCCQKYMIRIGMAPGGIVGSGQFKIQSDSPPCPDFPCDGVRPVVCDDCCGGRPTFTGFPGQIAIATQHRYSANEPVVRAFDLSGPGLNAPGTLSTPPAYDNPAWTLAKLGTVFGITLDDSGNVYVAQSAVFSPDALGAGGAGAVYKLDSATGAATTFATLPNSAIVGCVGTECYPGLGNLCFDCGSRNIYVTDFEDGRIYRLDLAGNVLSTFDHATGAITAGGAPEPGDANGFAPLGERVWAVQVNGGRLYYSLWVEDSARPSAVQGNQIWSIAINGAGQFVGAPQLEITVPAFPNDVWSSPVADITFTENCCMTIAERSMSGDTYSSAHISRVLQYCFDAATAGWAPSSATFAVGTAGLDTSAAGGVDLDFSTGGRLWATGDAASSPDVIYGLQGLPATGGNDTNSLLIDLDGEVTQQDKTQIGDVELPCPSACATIDESTTKCQLLNGVVTGNATWTFSLTNHSGVPVRYVLFADSNISPNVVVLNPTLANGASTTITVTISGLDPTATTYCTDLILADTQFNECCTIHYCVDLPDCDCMLVQLQKVVCVPGSGGDAQVSFNYVPVAFNAEYMFISPPLPPDPNSGITISPSFIDISTPAMTVGFAGPITIENAVPGSEVCLTVSIHAANLSECCAVQLCFDAPFCQVDACPGDLNGDGLVDGADLGLLLAVWGSGGGTPADLNQDGHVDGADLGLLLGAWGGCG
ncbi:MAG: hypothetical protein U0575_14830 [Phycisphaerales bacterium]